MIKIDVQGMAGIAKKLDNENLKGKLETAITKVAFLLQREAKIEAPVRTGFLRNHILVNTKSNLLSEVVSMAPYSVYVHEGTKNQKANPYMQRAVDIASDAIKKTLSDVFKDL